MSMKTFRITGMLFLLVVPLAATVIFAQAKGDYSKVPRIEIQNYAVEVALSPDAHELQAAAIITFKPLEPVNVVVFELSDNMSVQKVLTTEGTELEFSQNEIGPDSLSVRFTPSLSPDASVKIRIECQGGFDKDRFSRIYARDENSAYIGMEGTYLMYSAKWVPVYQFLVARAPGTIEVTVPLGLTVIGPGVQSPVITKGITETFSWTAKQSILPASFITGHYIQKKTQIGDFTLECYTKNNNPDAIQKSAEAAAKILDFYSHAFGPSASGTSFRLVEVDEPLTEQHGMLGTIFITPRELAQTIPPVRELARRIAYQWWQETVGIQSTHDLWLVDGMAYYSAAQYLYKTEGEAAYKDEIQNLAILALKFEKNSAVRVGLGLGYRTQRYESVVAGKGAWILNMLRGILGDAKFDQLVHQYFNDYAGNNGSTSAFQKLSEKLYGKDLNWFFTEWIDIMGVPELQADYIVFKTASGFRVSGTIRQDRDLFRMPVEVAVVNESNQEIKTVELNGKSTSFDINFFSLPKKIILDPSNKVLRDTKELQTAVQLSMGNDLKQKGSFVEAIKAYENAISLEPHKSLAHFRLAEVCYEQFNLQTSANSFRDALNGDKDPKWIEVWCYIYLGKIYDILGQRQRAMAEYTKAVNTKDDTYGAQAEANKWLSIPFVRERSTIDK
jgi:aminopeptidase N